MRETEKADTGLVFCKAVNNDLVTVMALYREAISNLINNNILQWDEIYPNEEVLSGDIDRGEMYLVKQKDKIISCVVINEEQDELYSTGNWKYPEGKVAVLHRLCVHPNTQGSGIGMKTVQFAETFIKDKGYDIIRLDTFSQNYAARHLYEKLMYACAGEVTLRKGLFYLLEKKVN